jgi:predicted ATPase
MAMIESIEFTNFKALRKATLPLAPFTLLLGPNGSGKTSVLQALQKIVAVFTPPNEQGGLSHSSMLSITAKDRVDIVAVRLCLRLNKQGVFAEFKWHPNGGHSSQFCSLDGKALKANEIPIFAQWINRMQIYSLDAPAIAQPAAVSAGPLQWNGAGLAAVLDDLKDNHPDRWELLLAEMRRWIPEYDYIMFEKPQAGSKAIVLRTKKGGHRISAHALSQGTLIALSLLTLAYLPTPPSLVGLEEIDRGLHPRLLRHLQDALYRLSYPESCGESRPPIQVIATTHSPYLLDLYREHPEEIVLAQKEGLEVQMKRLTDIEHYDEILGDSPLSEVWYSGVLGGVSVKP